MAIKIEALLSYELIHLAETKPLSSITVTELLQNTGISRATFYARFRDKNDLISYIYKTRCLGHCPPGKKYTEEEHYEILLKYYRTLQENRRFFRHASRLTGQNCFRDQIIDEQIAWDKIYFASLLDEQELSEDILAKIEYHANGQMHLIINWLNSDKPVSPEEMSRRTLEARKAVYGHW